jgi:hypothetical protein
MRSSRQVLIDRVSESLIGTRKRLPLSWLT